MHVRQRDGSLNVFFSVFFAFFISLSLSPIFLTVSVFYVVLSLDFSVGTLFSFVQGPFNFGRMLQKCGCMTRGVFCLEFARQARENPFTRAAVLGYVPLSKDPAVVMRHMSRIFGDSREMWHLLRAYIAAMTMHCIRDEWAARDLIVPQLHALLDRYQCTYNLKGSSGGADDHRALRACLQYVTTNYGTCLRDRLPCDSRTILAITDFLVPPPAHTYERAKALAMIEVVDRFSRLLAYLKQDNCPSLLGFIIDVDEYEHFVRERTTIDSVIARLFWQDSRSEQPRYRFLRLQTAIETALQDRVFGPLLTQAFTGAKTAFTVEDMPFRIALREPTGAHAGGEKYYQWSSEGRPKDQCTYCGALFATPQLMYAHLRAQFGPHFYNGQRAVLRAMYAFGVDADEVTLFRAAKQLLYKRYGEQYGALHTQRCKQILLKFIRDFKRIHVVASSVSARHDYGLRNELVPLLAQTKRSFDNAHRFDSEKENANRFDCKVCGIGIYDAFRWSLPSSSSFASASHSSSSSLAASSTFSPSPSLSSTAAAALSNVCAACGETDAGKSLIATEKLEKTVNRW